LKFLSNYSATRRYIADASYWIYLMHLPVVAAVPGLGGPLAAALEREVSFILVASFAICS
jgi:peptidoglycan/LPS O-acetylase OafA/YrhL